MGQKALPDDMQLSSQLKEGLLPFCQGASGAYAWDKRFHKRVTGRARHARAISASLLPWMEPVPIAQEKSQEMGMDSAREDTVCRIY